MCQASPRCTTNLARLELTVYTNNEPAQALYRKFGFEVEGRLRDYAVRDGQLVDALYMARLRRPAAPQSKNCMPS